MVSHPQGVEDATNETKPLACGFPIGSVVYLPQQYKVKWWEPCHI